MSSKELNSQLNFALGNRVKLLREHLGISRKELSEMVDISEYFLIEIEGGRKGVSIPHPTGMAISQPSTLAAEHPLSTSKRNDSGHILFYADFLKMLLQRGVSPNEKCSFALCADTGKGALFVL